MGGLTPEVVYRNHSVTFVTSDEAGNFFEIPAWPLFIRHVLTVASLPGLLAQSITLPFGLRLVTL